MQSILLKALLYEEDRFVGFIFIPLGRHSEIKSKMPDTKIV